MADENDAATEQRTNTEPVNTEVVAVPIPDVYVYQNNATTHIVNGRDYARERHTGGEVSTMCGGLDVQTAPDDDLPDGLKHLADTLDPEDVADNPVGIMNLTVLNLCGRCRASYGDEGVPQGVSVVRYEMDGSGWER